MFEMFISCMESVMWVGFQTWFHESRYTGWRKILFMSIPAGCLTLNIWIADYYVMYSSYTFLVDVLILMIYSALCLQDGWYWNLFSVMLFYLSLFTCNFFSMILFTKGFGAPLDELLQPQMGWRVLFLIVTKALLGGVCAIILWSKARLDSWKNATVLVLFFPALTIAIVSLLTGIFIAYYQHGGSILLITVLILAILIMLVICLYLLNHMLKEKQRKLENRILQNQIKLQEDSYAQLHEYLIKCREIQHDIKHKLVVVEQLLKRGDVAGGEQYLQRYIAETEGVSMFSPGDTVWNSVVTVKKMKAEEKNIKFYADIQCWKMERLQETDICVLLGNLLDNAIEAEEKMKGQGAVRLYIKEEFGIVFIKVGNRIENSILQTNPQLQSTKQNQGMHGLGVKCVREIVEKYKGTMEMNEDAGWFWVTIYFR